MRPFLAIILALFFAVPAMAQDTFGSHRSGYSRSDRKEAQKTVLKLLDKAKAEGHLSRGQKFRLGILFRVSPTKCCELLEAAAPEIAELEGQDATKYGAIDETGEASEGGLYALDIENLDGLLQLLLKYLPQIIELIMTMFAA